MNTKIIHQILTLCQRYQTYFIVAHSKPDGDTVGAMLALSSWLTRQKKQVDLYSADPVPRIYRFLSGTDKIQHTKQITRSYEIGFFLECNDFSRAGIKINPKLVRYIINIDHHLSNLNYGHINWVCHTSAALAEMIYQILKCSGTKLTLAEAQSLYVGLVTDTGKFQQKNTTATALSVATDLVRYGVSPNEIFKQVYARKTIPELKLLGQTLATLKTVAKGQVVYQTITNFMYQSSCTVEEDSEEIIDYPMLVPGTKISVLIRETRKPNLIKVSLRSVGKIDVHQVAKKFGGGGHLNAAGCTITGSLFKAKKLIIPEMVKLVTE